MSNNTYMELSKQHRTTSPKLSIWDFEVISNINNKQGSQIASKIVADMQFDRYLCNNQRKKDE